MIHFKELRVGNIIEPITKGPCRVTGISSQKVMDGDFILIYADYEPFLQEHVLPVKLTPEWFERWGFKKSQVTDFPDMYILNVIYPGRNSVTFKYWNFYLSVCQNDNCIPIPCEYAHTLQNIYFSFTAREL